LVQRTWHIMVLDTNTLTSYFANWLVDKEVDLGALGATEGIYNNIIESGVGQKNLA